MSESCSVGADLDLLLKRNVPEIPPPLDRLSRVMMKIPFTVYL